MAIEVTFTVQMPAATSEEFVKVRAGLATGAEFNAMAMAAAELGFEAAPK